MDTTADRKLDAMVAEKVMGWSLHGGLLVPPKDSPMRLWAARWDEDGLPDWLPRYSTFISDAWKILEKFDGFSIDLHRFVDPQGYPPHLCECIIWFEDGVEIGTGETMPMAICNAAINFAKNQENRHGN